MLYPITLNEFASWLRKKEPLTFIGLTMSHTDSPIARCIKDITKTSYAYVDETNTIVDYDGRETTLETPSWVTEFIEKTIVFNEYADAQFPIPRERAILFLGTETI